MSQVLYRQHLSFYLKSLFMESSGRWWSGRITFPILVPFYSFFLLPILVFDFAYGDGRDGHLHRLHLDSTTHVGDILWKQLRICL